ncbi:MAG: hypothetical protein JSV63_03935 [Candidatus Aenigmatarchaeota archaeon]|nr:MAG: hypothetical protein JSV63_03935 [Candidatus Aenigmarchaeota archaeon]
MHKWDKTFWMLFVLLEVAIILGNIWFFTPIGIIVGFVLIAIALARFGDYLLHKHNSGILDKNSENVERMKSWLNNQYQLTQSIKDLHDYRFHRMDSKKAALDEKLDKGYRELAGKIIDVENRLNLVSKAIVSQRDVMLPQPPQVITQVVEKPAEKVSDFFDDVWGRIVKIADDKGYIETLSRGVKNRILKIGENGIRIRSDLTKSERFLDKKEFRYFWQRLQAKGRLNLAKDIQDPRLLRIGSVVISFLARLPNVEHELKPRVLHLMGKDTHNLGTLRVHRKKI